MNWYIKIELHHGASEWDVLCKGFMMTFSFEDEWNSIDEVQEVKATIFRIPQELLELIQLEWGTQLSCTHEFYNVIVEQEDEDPWKINILEMEGHCEVLGPQIENPDIIAPVKTKQVNISMEEEPKIEKIGDYWDGLMVDKVTELLHEYQELFSRKFMDLKGIIRYLRLMKITLKPDVKPIKYRLYCLNMKYKEKVCLELDNMLMAGIIEPMEEFD